MGLPISVTVGPLIAGSATKVSLAQKSAAAGYLVLNGGGGTFSANSLCLSQTPGGAGALTLNGALVSSVPTGTAVAYLGTPSRIYITGGSDESGKTFTVSGYGFSASGGPYAVTETITGPNASVVSSSNIYSQIISITVSAATTGAITVGHYGTTVLDQARQILFTPAGNDAGITYAITGTDGSGAPIGETVQGVANPATAVTALDYKTVTSIYVSGVVASTMTVGTNGVAHSRWVRLDQLAAMAQVAIQCVPSAAGANFTVQQTLDDPNAYGSPVFQNPSAVTWINHPDTALVNASSAVQGNYAYTPVFARVQLNSGSGSVSGTFAQAYLN